jgi:hypothetical protein
VELIWNSYGMTPRMAVAIEKKPTRASRAALAKAVSYLRTLGYQTRRVGPGEIWKPQADKQRPEFILLGSGDAATVAGEVKRIRTLAPWAQVLVALEALTTRLASDVYGAGATVVAPASVFPRAVRNVVSGVWRVEERASRPYRATAVLTSPPRHPIEGAFVEGFHDRESGRLDAKRVADAYGVSLSALARGLKITQSALSKRPTAAAAQVGLRELEFAWATLRDVLETEERVRAWLNSKTRHLGDRAPIDLLTHGSVEALANYIRSVIAGEPG